MLPFVFIINPTLLFIGVTSIWEVVLVCVAGTIASLLFAGQADEKTRLMPQLMSPPML